MTTRPALLPAPLAGSLPAPRDVGSAPRDVGSVPRRSRRRPDRWSARRGLGAAAAVAVLAQAGTVSPALADSDESPCEAPGEFPDETLGDWKVREFSGMTDYSLVEEEGRRTLAAVTDGQASVLYRKRKVDVARTPVLAWSWKIDGVYAGIDERTRGGDDFPARVYVVARTGPLPWQTMALNYVWSSNQAPGSTWTNPFTKKARMIAVRSGAAGAGQWACERRDVVADFRAAFGKDVDQIQGYAIMVDGDNGNRLASARFGALGFEQGPGVD